MKLNVIIPFRGYKLSKQRLRESIDDQRVNDVIYKVFLHTKKIVDQINTLRSFILTADEDIEKDNSNTIIDDGNSLNHAIENAVNTIDSDIFFLIMADLPGLNDGTLNKILTVHQIHRYVIAPTDDGGTALAILPRILFREKLFGKNSASKIIERADSMNIPVAIINIKELNKDLDDLEDWNYWKRQTTGLFE